MPLMRMVKTAALLLVVPLTALPLAAASATGFDGSQPYALDIGSTQPFGMVVEGEHLFVSNLKTANLRVIDTTTAAVVGTIALPGGSTGIAAAPNGDIWVSQNDADTVTRVSNPLSATPSVTSFSLPAGSRASSVALSPDGTKVYVVEEHAKQVQQLDATTGEVLHTSAPGAFANVPSGIAVTPDGTVWTGNDALTAFTPDLSTTLDLTGLSPNGFAGPPLVSPDGDTMYVGREASVQVIDTGTRQLTGTISTTKDAGISGCTGCTALGEQITHLALTPDGKTLYATSYDYPWRTRIDIAQALAGDDGAFALMPGPTDPGADAANSDTWQYSNEMQVVGNALWTASDGANYDGTIVQRDPIAPHGSFGAAAAQVGDIVTFTGSGLADATVYLDGAPVKLTHDEFSKLSFAMPAYPSAHSVAVTVATSSTGADPVGVGSLDYSLRSFTPPAPAVAGISGGRAHVGAALTAIPGAWPAGTTVRYQWIYNDTRTPIRGAIGRTYVPTAADYTGRHTIGVRTWGTKPGYVTSTPIGSTAYSVAAGTLRKSRPTITGKAKVGRKLRANHRTWTAGTIFRYRWYASGKRIPRATRSTYKIAKKYAHKRIAVRVIGSKAGYLTASATSRPTRRVARG